MDLGSLSLNLDASSGASHVEALFTMGVGHIPIMVRLASSLIVPRRMYGITQWKDIGSSCVARQDLHFFRQLGQGKRRKFILFTGTGLAEGIAEVYMRILWHLALG